MKKPAPARLAKIRTKTEMISGFTSKAGGRQAESSLYDRRRSRWPAHLFALFVVVLTSALGVWQLQRAAGKARAQAQQVQAQASQPVRLDGDALAALSADPGRIAALDGHLVQLRARFDPAHTLLLDNRTHQGVAGFHVLAPAQVEGSDHPVMVLRGWIARDPLVRTRLPPLPTPEGMVEIEGLVQKELAQPMTLGGADGARESAQLWQHYDPALFAAWAGRMPAPLVVRQTVEPAYADGLVRDWNQPGTGVDRHRAYALQWVTMAAVALGAWLWLTLRRRPSSGPVPAGDAAAGGMMQETVKDRRAARDRRAVKDQ